MRRARHLPTALAAAFVVLVASASQLAVTAQRRAPERTTRPVPTTPAPSRAASRLPVPPAPGQPRAGEPATLVPVYQAASVRFDVDWRVLAAINLVETDLGRDTHVSTAGAVGWMQFMPATWRAFGVDASGDGVADPDDPTDAIHSAARYLAASGFRRDPAGAVWAYNHAEWYVRRVLALSVALPAAFDRVP